jgi:hypothetical protein
MWNAASVIKVTSVVLKSNALVDEQTCWQSKRAGIQTFIRHYKKLDSRIRSHCSMTLKKQYNSAHEWAQPSNRLLSLEALLL